MLEGLEHLMCVRDTQDRSEYRLLHFLHCIFVHLAHLTLEIGLHRLLVVHHGVIAIALFDAFLYQDIWSQNLYYTVRRRKPNLILRQYR